MHQNIISKKVCTNMFLEKKVFTKISLVKAYALKYGPQFYRFMDQHNIFKQHKVFKEDLSK